MNTVGSDPTVSAAAVPSDVHPAELKAPVSASIGERSNNTPGPLKFSDSTIFKKIDEVEHVNVDFVTSLISALDENAGKSVSVRRFSSENYQTVDIVANPDHITEMSHTLQDVYDEHKQTLRVPVQRNRFYFSRGVLTVTLWANAYETDSAAEALLE